MRPDPILIVYCEFLLTYLTNAVQFNVFGTLGRRKEFVCHEEIILQCIVNAGTDPVFWQIGKPVDLSTVIAAECSGQACNINPAVSGTYNFSYDENAGISNLTIFSVTLLENETQYKCDDGSSPPPAPFEGIVQVPPNKDTTRISEIAVSNSTNEITVTTGCILNASVDLVKFQWSILKEGDNVSMPYSPINSIYGSNEVPCQGNSDCLTSGSVEISNTITVEDIGDENCKASLQLQVIFSDIVLFTKTTDSMYHLKEACTSGCKCWVKNRCFMIFVLIATPLLFLQTWLGLCLGVKHKNWFKIIVLLLGLLSPGLGVFAKSLELDGCKSKCKIGQHLASKSCILGIYLLCLCMITLHILPPVLCKGCDVHTNVLYIIVGVNLFLIYLYGGCFTLYIVHESEEERRNDLEIEMKRRRVKEIKRERQMERGRERRIELRREEVNRNTTLTGKYICDECKKEMSIKSYCIKCHTFLCNSCDAYHHCKGTRLRHLQHEANARDADIPCANKHYSSKQTHGYCLTCRKYLCTECLIIHNTHVLLWIPHGDVTKNDRLCCFKGHTDRKEETVLGYCIQCDMYVCIKCSKKHDGEEHKLIMHQNEGGVMNKCECECMAECLHLNSRRYLCSDCYDREDLMPVRDKGRIKDVKLKLLENRQKCMIHHVFGMGKTKFTTDVFCLKCKLYMCSDCFSHHKRLKEDWIRTHENNLFTCKKCQAKRNVFPVECLLLYPVMLLCAECFESGDISNKNVPEIYDEDVMEAIRSLVIKKPCQIHMPPFQEEREKESRSLVYCLMCKTYMCKDCFQKHRRLKSIMTPTSDETIALNRGTSMDRRRALPPIPDLPPQSATITAAKTTCTSKLLLKIFGFVPVVGILFTIGCICLRKYCNMARTRRICPPVLINDEATHRT